MSRNQIAQIAQELAGWLRKIAAGGSPEHRAQVLRAAAQFAATMLSIVQAKLTGTTEVFRRRFAAWFGVFPTAPNPFNIDSHTRTARLHYLGAYGTLGLEIVMAVGLTIQRTNLNILTAVVVGTALAVGLTLAAKGFFANRVAMFEETPTVAREYIGWWLRRLTFVTVAALSVIFMARAADESLLGIVGAAFGIAMAALGIVAPLLSAANWVAADLFHWSHRLTREWETLAGMNAQLEHLKNNNEPPDAPPSGGVPVPVIPMIIIIMMLLGAGTAKAQTRGYLFPDASSSVDSTSREPTVTAITDKVSELGRHGTRLWSVVPFSDDAFRALGRTFAFDDVNPQPCTTISPAATPREIDVFKAATEARERDARRECAKAVSEVQAAYERQWNNTLAAIKAAVAAPGRSGSCTGIVDLLRRIARLRDAVAIVTTDGVESCGEWRHVDPPPSNVRTYIVLLPSKNSTARSYSTDWEERAARLRRFAPWAQIIAPWEISDAITR